MIHDRIHHARLSAQLTLHELGQRVGVSHTAIQKYEKGLITPSSAQLLKLAQACGVRTEYFFRTNRVTLNNPEFRKEANFGKKAQEALKLRVIELVEPRIELLGAFPSSPLPMFTPPTELPHCIQHLDELEHFANAVRTSWDLGTDPIADLTDALESLGCLMIMVDEQHPGFSGLTAMAVTDQGDQFPVIALSKQSPGDRQRFTLAHELGHLLLSGRLSDDLNEEAACNRFAGAFLAPKNAVLKRLGSKRQVIEWPELYALKHEFGLSMGGWLHRAKECKVITEATYLKLARRFSVNGWRTQEPGDALANESPRLFEQLVYRALAERHISESKAAELLRIPLMRFHQQRQLESFDAVGHQ
jgi:Zn-dependent peptidase ImmA (M78 family)/DNA-binding XRE family transcriptional regulator